MGDSKERYDITKVFPSAFRHVISFTKSSRNGFIGEVRASLKTKRDITAWIKAFEKNTNSKLIATNVSKCERRGSKNAVEMNYVCSFNKNKTDKVVAKTNCPAYVNLRVIEESKSSSYRDAYAKQGLFGIIKINSVHNHGVNSTRMLRSNSRIFSSLQNCEKEVEEDKDKATEDGSIQLESPKTKISRNSSKECVNVPSCAYCNTNEKEHSRRRLFRFPKDSKMCKKWVEACQDSVLMEKTVSKLRDLKMCSAHFVASDYVGSSKTRLKRNACPSLFTEKNSESKNVPPKSSSKNRNAVKNKNKSSQTELNESKLKKVESCYEGFASYDSSSDESSDFDEVPLDIPFGFEKDNTEFKKSQTLTSDFPRPIYTGGQRPRAVEFQIRFVCSQNCSNR